jgi:hypothetical protein
VFFLHLGSGPDRTNNILALASPTARRKLATASSPSRACRRAKGAAVEFDAVLIRIAQVQGFADAVIAGAIERHPGGDQPPQRVGEIGARRVDDRKVIKPPSRQVPAIMRQPAPVASHELSSLSVPLLWPMTPPA